MVQFQVITWYKEIVSDREDGPSREDIVSLSRDDPDNNNRTLEVVRKG